MAAGGEMMMWQGAILRTDLASDLASRGFVDNTRPPMAAAAELLSAVGRSGDDSNEDDDVELWLVQMPDAKSLDLRALDGAQLHLQAGALGQGGAHGDGGEVELCRFAPPGAAPGGGGAAGGKGFVWGGQQISELSLLSDALPRGGLVAILPRSDGQPPIVRAVTRSVTCVAAAAVPHPEPTRPAAAGALSTKKKGKQKKSTNKAGGEEDVGGGGKALVPSEAADVGGKGDSVKKKKKRKEDADGGSASASKKLKKKVKQG